MKKIINISIIISVIILLILNISCIPDFSTSSPSTQNEEPQIESQESNQFTLSQFNSKINSLVEKVMPSVVSIQVGVVVENLFGQEETQQGVGSGIILNEEGYILTNSHVVGDAEKLIVTLDDGSRVDAKLIGANQDTDVGVIKIDSNNLKPAKFGSIEDQKVGDIVIAVGSPFGIQQTVTLGIISGKGRIIPTASDQLPIIDAIQTDAAINPGNSGGPLINIKGEVVGINTIGISPSGASSGVGFAIPIDTAKNIAEQIIEYGRARIPYMGIEIGQNNTGVVGALIANVVDGSPADNAGLRKGDIIVEFDGKQIKTPYEILSQLLRKNCGQEIQLKIYREGEYKNISLSLGECPSTR